MTLFYNNNVNNHILNGVHYIWWPIGEFVSAEQGPDLLNFEPPYREGWLRPCFGASCGAVLVEHTLAKNPGWPQR